MLPLGRSILVGLAFAGLTTAFNPNALGNYSPYHTVSAPAGVSADLPSDCTVNQVVYLSRHGSRYPDSSAEYPLIKALSKKLVAHAADLANANLPLKLAFLQHNYTAVPFADNITAIGRQQVYEHGASFRRRYPHLPVTAILASGSQRVEESAYWFGAGYFGPAWLKISSSALSVLPENNHTVSFLAPQETCPNWPGVTFFSPYSKISVPPITRRLNAALPNVNLTDYDTLAALLSCPFDLAAGRAAPWCSAFTDDEWRIFEANVDLGWDLSYSYALPGDMPHLLGALYVHKLLDRLERGAQKTYVDFAHDDTFILALTAMDLIKDVPPLDVGQAPPVDRKLSTSRLTPFAAQLSWEKFTCTRSFKGPHVRAILNGAPLPLTTCQTKTTARYGACTLGDFIKVNSFAKKVTWGDAAWNATCGNPGF